MNLFLSEKKKPALYKIFFSEENKKILVSLNTDFLFIKR